MSYTHTLGALNLNTGTMPSCAPADVIADAKAACNVYSSVRGFGALVSQLVMPTLHPYSNDPTWAKFPSCDVARLPVCPKVSVIAATYKPTMTIATYIPPKVPAIITQIKAPVVALKPPTLISVTVPTAVAPVPVRVSATVATYIPPAAPHAPTLQAAAQMVHAGASSVLVQMPDKTVVAVENPAAVDEAGMSSGAKAGILALVALGAYGVWRYSKKKG